LRFIFILGAATFFALNAFASANLPEQITFSILKEGEKIGQEIVSFNNSGKNLRVNVTTRTDVNVLFLKFHYDHKRQEIWQDGQFHSMTTDTNDDGDFHKLSMKRQNNGGIKLIADQVERELSSHSIPLTLWTKAIIDAEQVHSVINGEAWNVSTKLIKQEEILIQGKQVKSDHFRMSGDIERDLWYGKNGILLKTKFKKKGFDIEFIKQ